MPNDFFLKHSLSGWSQRVNGFSGRIRMEFEDLNPGLRYAVYLELKNYSFDIITVNNKPQIHAELFDVSGKKINSIDLPGYGPDTVLQWAVIPHDAYIGFRIDGQGVGVPAREQGKILLATGRKNWLLAKGRYILKAVAAFNKETDGPFNQWNGMLILPPVEIAVTEEMFKAK